MGRVSEFSLGLDSVTITLNRSNESGGPICADTNVVTAACRGVDSGRLKRLA